MSGRVILALRTHDGMGVVDQRAMGPVLRAALPAIEAGYTDTEAYWWAIKDPGTPLLIHRTLYGNRPRRRRRPRRPSTP